MKRFFFIVPVILTALAACTTLAPTYQPDFNNTLVLKRMTGRAKVGEFLIPEEKRDIVNNISLRASRLQSPYNDSFAEYVREALKRELREADRFSDSAETEVAGILLENSFDASGIKLGVGQMSARFLVRNGANVRYDQVITVKHEWPSAFPGAIAIPTARDNYPVMVQKLIKQLLADPKFAAALNQK